MRTLEEQLAEALILAGWIEGQKYSHYRSFIRPGSAKKMFVGKAGALRTGASPSSSRSLTDTRIYKELLGIANLPNVDLKV